MDTAFSLTFFVILGLMFNISEQACNQTSLYSCAIDVRSSFPQYCGGTYLAEQDLHKCRTKAECTDPRTVPDLTPIIDEIKVACELYGPCAGYYSCIKPIVKVDFDKVLIRELLETEKANSLPTNICSKRSDYPDLEKITQCSQQHPYCVLVMEKLLGGNYSDDAVQIDNGFIEVLNRFKEGYKVTAFMDQFCSEVCDPFGMKLDRITDCTDWPTVVQAINQGKTTLCQDFSTAVKCLKAWGGQCAPLYEYYHELADDLKKEHPEMDVYKAASTCNVSLPVPAYSTSSADYLGISLKTTMATLLFPFTVKLLF